MKPGIILLKEGSDDSQGLNQILSNISACLLVVDSIKSTLGPKGMDKIIVDNAHTIISNDGATIIQSLEIIHPAAQILASIAHAQDMEIGDGTTSVVVIAGELLKNARSLLEENIPPQKIAHVFQKATSYSKKLITEISVQFDKKLLRNLAKTALNSKLVSVYNDIFSDIVVKAITYLSDYDLKRIATKKIKGGILSDSCLIQGVAFKKCFSYAGFEMQTKYYKNPKIAMLNIELELKAEKQNAEIRIKDVKEYQKIVDAEWKILYDKLDSIVKSGANIVLSKNVIGDVATQYFADHNVFCAGRVTEEDIGRVVLSCGGSLRSTLDEISDYLGECEVFEERQIGDERFNVFSGGKCHGACTIILRGAGEIFLDEIDRSLHDALMVVRKALLFDRIVAGGGATEMYISRRMREYSLNFASKEQLIFMAFAKSLEIIPRQLCQNAGIDSSYIMNTLRVEHSNNNIWAGVDLDNECVRDSYEACVWEPAEIKINEILSATEAACTILTADETIKNAKRENKIGR